MSPATYVLIAQIVNDRLLLFLFGEDALVVVVGHWADYNRLLANWEQSALHGAHCTHDRRVQVQDAGDVLSGLMNCRVQHIAGLVDAELVEPGSSTAPAKSSFISELAVISL